MPELPEVQTVVNQLNRKVAGKTIAGFKSLWSKKIHPAPATFSRKVKGATIVRVRRLGKHIVIDLNNGLSVVAHLKMTGHFLVKTPENRTRPAFTEDRMNGYIHHVFTFLDGTLLEFSDMRKFGWIRLMPTAEVESLPSIRALGIDALSPRLTTTRLREILQKRAHRPIAPVLLEQGLIAGIGNIYRSEGLFLAGIIPERPIVEITPAEWPKLLSALKSVLRASVRLRGTSDGDFRDTDGLPGRFQRTLYVYRRDGLACKRCGTIILRKKMGQRSVFYCPQCQK